MARNLLWASLALAPVVFILNWVVGAGDGLLFVLGACALIPLAWLIGEATEHAGEHTGPGIGGFLNATFGNAPELIIAILAINQGLPNVVRGSLAGSVASNILLVLGAALAVGRDARVDRRSLTLQLGLVVFATLTFLIPSSSGLATVAMPIMSPLAGLADVDPALVVTAFQSGNGLVNLVNPTFAVVMGGLAIARVGYGTWLRFVWPVLILLAVLVVIVLSVSVLL